jgi:bacillithiol system protein YtxJ
MCAYYLILIAFRLITQTIAERFQGYHESPHILLIRNVECVLDASHNGISPAEIDQEAKHAFEV